MPQQKPPDLDTNLQPIQTKPPDLDEGGNIVPEEPSLLGKAWSAISTPLITKPAEWAHQYAQELTDPNTHPGWLKSFGAGALEGAGNLLSESTSPVNLALMAATGGESAAAKAGLPQIARLLNIGGKVAGVPTALHGAGTIFDPNTSWGEKGMGALEVAGGMAPFAHVPEASVAAKEAPAISKTAPIVAKTERDAAISELGLGKAIAEKPQATTIYIKNPKPEYVKQAMEQGYTLDSTNPVREDGAYKMVKTGKPRTDLPLLESEVKNAAPTPRNAARQASDVIEPQKGQGLFTRIYNLPRTIEASIDLSAPLRQGLPLIHKKAFWTSLTDMVKSAGSEQAYQDVMTDIRERPLFRDRPTPSGKIQPSFAKQAGLSLTDLDAGLTGREEAIQSDLAEKIPVAGKLIRGSNRAYTAYLNKLRADTFEDLITRSKVFGADGEANLPLAREIANFVNTATGRGSLGNLERAAPVLNNLLFSPRLIASRLRILNPAYYIMANPTVRKEALKSLFSLAAVGTTITQLGKMAGGTVESDPASSDFGKLKIGNTRVDPYAGFQQYVVAANRLITGRNVSSTTGKEYDVYNPKGPYDPTALDVGTRFVRGKVHPVLGFAWSLFNGAKEMSGQKMNFATMNPMENSIMQRFIPILAQDIYQLYQEDPTLLPALGALSALGMGVQTYGTNR